MLRTRLLSFAFGFSVAGAAISHLVWRDLWIDQHSLSSEMKQKFDALDSRVVKLESIVYQKPKLIQSLTKLCSHRTECNYEEMEEMSFLLLKQLKRGRELVCGGEGKLAERSERGTNWGEEEQGR
ncbi:hypothetical protein HHK36_019959 [Tetracentron sinense]|uniref:Uncharacterized protein n=1 Tax=Tetracentron sinense TaxID=13715 RepID=A0A834YWA3_TETSI|nr:hypothetical protein HHK36_019959 [Tetracentron sinense]